MNLFNKLPGFVRSAPGWEQRIWRRLPAILLCGTLLPLLLSGLNHLLAPAVPATGGSEGALLMWDYALWGVVALHWNLVLTLGLGCVIVRVMKGPAYVADAYPLPLPLASKAASDDSREIERLSDAQLNGGGTGVPPAMRWSMRAMTSSPLAEYGSNSGQTIFVCGSTSDRRTCAMDHSP